MKYVVGIGSGAMIDIQSFITTGSGIQKLIEGETQTHGQDENCISLLLFYQNKASKLKIEFILHRKHTMYLLHSPTPTKPIFIIAQELKTRNVCHFSWKHFFFS
jgi:hypothetical protein